MRGSHHGYTRAGRGLLITSCVLLALVGPSLSTGALPAARAQSPHARLSDAPVALSGSTPRPVLQGKARLLGHYNPDQMLRLVCSMS